MQKERARKNRLEREEREKREEKEAREKPIKIAALKQKAAEEAKAKKAKPRFQSDENAIRNSSSDSSSRDDLGDITRCMSLPTPDARVKCVDGNQAKYY